MSGPVVPRRLRAEGVVAGIGVVLAVVAARVPDRIERLGGAGSDGGSGGTERAIVIVFLVAAAVLAALARVEWRRPMRPLLARNSSGGDGR